MKEEFRSQRLKENDHRGEGALFPLETRRKITLFVIASVFLEIQAQEGSEFDGPGGRFAGGDFGDVYSVKKYRRSLVRSPSRLPVGALMEICQLRSRRRSRL